MAFLSKVSFAGVEFLKFSINSVALYIDKKYKVYNERMKIMNFIYE